MQTKRLELGALVLLTVATFGTYVIYWFYATWRSLEEISGSRMRPALRTIGLCIPLLNIYLVAQQWKQIGELNASAEKPVYFPVAWTVFGYLAACYLYTAYLVLIILSIAGDMPPTGAEMISLSFIDLISFSVMGLLLAAPQRALNAQSAYREPAGTTRMHLTPGQIAWLAVGGVAWSISLLQPFFAQVT